MYNKYF